MVNLVVYLANELGWVMSVSCGYTGRFGNNLFQYSLARLFATLHGLEFHQVWPHDHIIKPRPYVGGDKLFGDTLIIGESNIDELFWKRPVQPVYFGGFFQHARFYNPYRDLIRGFYELPDYIRNTNDVVIHLRADDYSRHHQICSSWHREILSGIDYNNLFIVMSPVDEDYLREFDGLDYKLVSGSACDDFWFINSFDRILCANSTFSWWAAFLGCPSQVFLFKDWLSVDCIDLCNISGGITVGGKYRV